MKPAVSSQPPASNVARLTEEQCWLALATIDVGRLAVRAGDDIDIFPINFLTSRKLLYFRTAPGIKMIELTKSPRVAFEADNSSGGQHWSVTLKGVAERLSLDSEIKDSGVQHLRSFDPATKWNYVRVTPHSVTGRRFEIAGESHLPKRGRK
jgi:nitroimidazol reductase NimA-like FMN-containing flavoprotein (pyridoxamine 5'-phosphate oxidase superfamily)